MQQSSLNQSPTPPFVDRRQNRDGNAPGGQERRQFTDAREHAQPEALELAEAIDQYKLLHRRRFITYEELYDVIMQLGYHK